MVEKVNVTYLWMFFRNLTFSQQYQGKKPYTQIFRTTTIMPTSKGAMVS